MFLQDTVCDPRQARYCHLAHWLANHNTGSSVYLVRSQSYPSNWITDHGFESFPGQKKFPMCVLPFPLRYIVSVLIKKYSLRLILCVAVFHKSSKSLFFIFLESISCFIVFLRLVCTLAMVEISDTITAMKRKGHCW